MAEALIIDACRTPRGIGKAGKGGLSGIHPQQLGATVLRALAERTGIDTANVDDIIWGTAAQVGPQSGDLGRMSALDAGYDVRASGVTLDRFCGSGITSVNMAAHAIMCGAVGREQERTVLALGGAWLVASAMGATISTPPAKASAPIAASTGGLTRIVSSKRWTGAALIDCSGSRSSRRLGRHRASFGNVGKRRIDQYR